MGCHIDQKISKLMNLSDMSIIAYILFDICIDIIRIISIIIDIGGYNFRHSTLNNFSKYAI